MRTHYFSTFLLGGLTAASPLNARQASGTTAAASSESGAPSGGGGGGGGDMAKAILAIMPSSNTCDGATLPDDCRTAEQAAPFVSEACADFSDGETAAMLALMGLESVDFKYKHNLSNGNPGQDCLVQYIKQYATSIFGAEKVEGKSPAEVLDMVTPDEYNFGSAAWFLETQCDSGVREGLEGGTDAAWNAYMDCVGVDGADSNRMEYWNRAKKAFGL
ncbi:hypothetical protein MMYC01_202809 [Madurella mycetomatis]|uniref:Uncharacterized protein n=1 Tax=Madurella mycetomatis TaxID=100816 RepID=A0A175W7R2_9PEZI|nr:hypothetical protein MMYC01_202809 [Madurella mycetomatis]